MSWLENLFSGPSAGSLIGAGLGAIAGGSSKGEEVSATKQLDPRIGRYIYGADGNGGLLADAQSIYSQQMQQGGLNDLQRQGLGMRTQYLQSPQYQNSYQAMMNQGMGLMGAGIAGNPFTRSQQRPQAQSMGQGGFQYSPAQSQAPIYRPAPQQAPAQTQASQPSTNLGMTGSGGNISAGSGKGSSAQGSGYSEDGISAALGAMALSENPAIRALFPTVAAALGLGGRLGADSQIAGVSSALGAMDGIAKTAMPGVGSLLNADGTVSTVSTPGLISAADRALFGDPSMGDGPDQSSVSYGGGYGVRGTGGGFRGGYGGGIGQSGGNAAGMGSYQG